MLMLAAVPAQATDSIFDSASAHACFLDLLRDASWGLAGPYERAAFVVESGDGTLRCVPWPATHGYLSEHFHGVFPEGTVAIVHTHPADRPQPSGHDIQEAARIGLPIYVLSIEGVYKANVEDWHVQRLARGRSWLEIPKAVATKPAATARSASR